MATTTQTPNSEQKLAAAGSEFETMQRFFEHLWTPLFRPWARQLPAEGLQLPALDMHREGNNLVVRAALPGMAKDEIKLSVTGQVLTIEGAHKEEKKREEKGRYLSEIYQGRIFRSVQLPVEVDATKVKAEHKDGMLSITLPVLQPEHGKPHTVPIN